jgi:hypothetical protein
LKPALLVTSCVLLTTTAGCDGCSKAQPTVADAAPIATTIPDAAPLNAAPVSTALVAKALNPDNLPAYAGPTGSVEGTITITGDPPPETPKDFKRCPDGVKEYGHAFREGQAGGRRWLADANLSITGYSGYFVQPKGEAEELTIKDCGFERRTVTMTFGQRLEVKNLTKEYWTPKLEPAQTTVMMMATPHGDSVKLYPKEPGHYRIVDHDRKYATADLYVLRYALHGTSRVGGAFRIDGVPVGKMKLIASHPALSDVQTKDIEIKDGVVTRMDFELTYKAPDAGAPIDAGPGPRLH